MDVDRSNFWHTLPTVLEAITLADYVAIDLEMIGVFASGHSIYKAHRHSQAAAYQRAADAARMFQILQFGMTCLSYSCEQSEYRSRTFTFRLTPEFTPPSAGLAKLIDRKLVLSCSSFLFLKENNFSFEKAFSQGIPYLSRSEEVLARGWYLTKPRDRSGFRDFPPHDSCHRRHDAITEQTGFRYILDALTSQPLPPSLLHHPQIPPSHLHLLKTSLQTLSHRLLNNNPILIAHNPLLDLAFLHHTLVSPLQQDLSTFCATIHTRLVPRIVDTKYLASQVLLKSGSKETRLETVYRAILAEQEQEQEQDCGMARIVPDAGFDIRDGAAHNAGFDSWMTAVVCVGLVGKMGRREPGWLSCGDTFEGVEKGVAKNGEREELFWELSPFCDDRRLRPSGGLERDVEGRMPGWDSEIWRRYGNKLWLGQAGVLDLEGGEREGRDAEQC